MISPSHVRTSKGLPRWNDILLIFAIALVARAGWGIYRMEKSGGAGLEFPDEEQYWFIAQSIADGNGLRDDMGFRATRMPLYPAFLSPFAESPNGVAIAKGAQWGIAALAAPLVMAIGCRLASRRHGLLCGIIVALDPFLVFFSSLLLTESTAITMLCLFWMLLTPFLQLAPESALESPREPKCAAREMRRVSWGRWALAGAAAAACVYLREVNLGLVVITLAVLAAFHRCDARVLGGVILVLAMVASSLFPWALRNKLTLGEWRWLTTRGGVSLFDGVGPQATGASDLGPIQRTGRAADLAEKDWNAHFYRESWQAIAQDPQRIFRLAGRKLVRLWNPFPNVESYRSGYTAWIAAVWTIAVFTLAAVGALTIAFAGRARTVAFCLLPAVYLSLIHGIYVGSVRYRLPAMPLIAVLAAMALSDKHRKSSHE